VLYRSASDRTQLLDESDGWRDFMALQSILNSGYQRDGCTLRCDPNTYRPEIFQTYAARAIAGIGRKILSDTTADRTFFIPLVKQTRVEQRERIRERSYGPLASVLKTRIEAWVKANRGTILAAYDQPRPDYLEGFEDRTADISEPLAAILEASCGT